MRGLIKRTPECALHVHVAMPSPDAAVAGLMGLREALPLIGALGAGSPFWFGIDSGLASARSAVIRAYPGRGLPPPLSGWEDYLEALDGIAAGGGPKDHTMVWWDARLQPRLGTIELRELDVQTGLEEAAGVAALVHALARRAAEQPLTEPAPDQALHWSSFRAVRDGLDAELLFRGRLRPAREAVRELLDELRGEDDALEGVERILSEGGAPARQRAVHAEGGMPALLRHLADETARRSERPPSEGGPLKGVGPLRGFAQRRDRLVLREPAQRLVLELAHSLAREAEPAAGLAQGLGLLAIEAEAQRDHGPLVLGQRADGLAQGLEPISELT